MEDLKILELFSGIGGMHQALQSNSNPYTNNFISFLHHFNKF